MLKALSVDPVKHFMHIHALIRKGKKIVKEMEMVSERVSWPFGVLYNPLGDSRVPVTNNTVCPSCFRTFGRF